MFLLQTAAEFQLLFHRYVVFYLLARTVDIMVDTAGFPTKFYKDAPISINCSVTEFSPQSITTVFLQATAESFNTNFSGCWKGESGWEVDHGLPDGLSFGIDGSYCTTQAMSEEFILPAQGTVTESLLNLNITCISGSVTSDTVRVTQLFGTYIILLLIC